MKNVLSLSGGRDSTALAIYMKDRIDAYVFCDTGLELPETYEHINKLATYTKKPLIVIKNKSFKYWMKYYNGFIPSCNARWCTRILKIKPFDDFIKINPNTNIFVGLRADEEKRISRTGLYKNNYIYPFKEDNIKIKDVYNILKDFQLPSFYNWKSRSGCYACPFMKKLEWIGLYKHYPKLFKWAENIEKQKNYKYTWYKGCSLKKIREEAASKTI